MTANPHQLSLEPAAQSFVEATANPPYQFQLPPAGGRKAVDEVQRSEIAKPDVHEEWITVEGGPTGSVPARIVRPPDAQHPARDPLHPRSRLGVR